MVREVRADGTLAPLDLRPTALALVAKNFDTRAAAAGAIGISSLIAERRIQGQKTGDLDAAMKHGAGWPLGPCELADLVGIDVHVHASEALWEKLREPRMAPPPRLVAMANAGLLGRKTGRGFYEYE